VLFRSNSRFLRGFPTQILYVFLVTIRATCQTHSNLFVFTTRETLHHVHKSLCVIRDCSLTSSFLCRNIFLSTLFSHTGFFIPENKRHDYIFVACLTTLSEARVHIVHGCDDIGLETIWNEMVLN
jgi:hypothetical protein